jgi:hypothetical protein
MSSQIFHQTTGEHVQEIIMGERFEPQILESFDPVTQKLYQKSPAIIHKQSEK